MPLKASYENLDEVPEHFRELFSQKDGKGLFELTGIEGMKTQADVDRLVSAAANERKATATWKAKAEAFGEHTPETIAALVAKNEELNIAVQAKGPIDDTKINEMVEV